MECSITKLKDQCIKLCVVNMTNCNDLQGMAPEKKADDAEKGGLATESIVLIVVVVLAGIAGISLLAYIYRQKRTVCGYQTRPRRVQQSADNSPVEIT